MVHNSDIQCTGIRDPRAMIIKLMADEEKKRAFHASGEKTLLGIEEEATTGSSPGPKKKRRLHANEQSKGNDEIVETFLQSLGAASKGPEGRPPQTGIKKKYNGKDKKAKGLADDVNRGKKQHTNAKSSHARKGNETTSPSLQDGITGDNTRRKSPPNRLHDQDQPRGVNPLNAAASDLRSPAALRATFDTRLSSEYKSPLDTAGSAVSGAAGFLRQMTLPGFASDRTHQQQLPAAPHDDVYGQNISSTLDTNLARQALGLPPQVTSGTQSITSSLNELRRLQEAQQLRRLPSSDSPNSLRMALSSMYSRQPQRMDLSSLGTSSKSPALPTSLTHMMPSLPHLGYPGLNLFAPGLGQFNRGGGTMGAFGSSNPNPSLPQFNRLLDDLSSRSARTVAHSSLPGTNGLLPARGDQSGSLRSARPDSSGTADFGATLQEGSSGSIGSGIGDEKNKQDSLRRVPIYAECDELCLSKFQCLARKQIEVFEANEEDVQTGARGRNNPIVLGQVGIRCRHCSHLPHQARTRGAVYYPTKFDRVYQTAVNMASIHLCNHCACIPKDIRDELLALKDQKSIAGGGKDYWANGIRMLGIIETEEGLKFADSESPRGHLVR